MSKLQELETRAELARSHYLNSVQALSDVQKMVALLQDQTKQAMAEYANAKIMLYSYVLTGKE